MISIIAAVGKNKELGLDNKLPWYLPGDLKFFKKTTLNHPVIMGKNTYLSIGKPLANRVNVVLSSKENFEGVINARSLEDALKLFPNEEVFIIGGASLYNATIDLCDCIYLTVINREFKADTFFPDFNENDFNKTLIDSNNDFDMSYNHYLYRRKNER